MPRKALGRGSAALFPESSLEVGEISLTSIPVDSIVPNPLQPRKDFNSEQMEELANSVREHGIVQPVIVCRRGEIYQLIVGERRWRAAQIVGLREIPAVIREITDSNGLEVALIENLQREDLNPLEEAKAYHFLIREHGLTQEDLATRVGKSRPAITNTLRLLNLPEEIQKDLLAGKISAGHARAILSFERPSEQIKIWQRIIKDGLSVRQSEELVRKIMEGQEKRKSLANLTPDWVAVEEELARSLGTQVKIRPRSKESGRIVIHYSSREDLERLVEYLKVKVYGRAGKPRQSEVSLL